MTRTKTLVPIGRLFAAVVAWYLLFPVMHADAQPAKIRQKWEYATLSAVYDAQSIATWDTGKTTLKAEYDNAAQLHPFSKLNKNLGGKEERGSLVVLLNRIGQDGWELVSHTRTQGPTGVVGQRVTETWTFKRPVP
jgi:hypothetical protein